LKGSGKDAGGAPIHGEKIKVSYILVDKFRRAQELYEDIQTGKRFEILAQKFSTCPSKIKVVI